MIVYDSEHHQKLAIARWIRCLIIGVIDFCFTVCWVFTITFSLERVAKVSIAQTDQ